MCIRDSSYTEEQDAKVCAALGERFVARTDFNDKVSKLKEAEAQVTQLNTAIKTRDTQLEELRKAAGDNAELQKQIDTLTQQNKADKASYEKELASIRLTAAVDAELTAAGARNNVAVRAVLADFLKDAKIVDGKVSAKVGDETVTLAAKVDALKTVSYTHLDVYKRQGPGWSGRSCWPWAAASRCPIRTQFPRNAWTASGTVPGAPTTSRTRRLIIDDRQSGPLSGGRW